MHHFNELKAWQLSMEICKNVHELVRKFPAEEKFVLIPQVMRAAISVPSNIAEGCGRRSVKELQHFLLIALGSAFEMETQITLAYEFSYISTEEFQLIKNKIAEVQKMINGFYKSLSGN